MKPDEWEEVANALTGTDIESCFEAAGRLHREASAEDVPNLLVLLRDGGNFFVREAAAWPLAELAGPEHLRALLSAYQRGFEEGHDNDGFTAALLEIPALFPGEAKEALEQIVNAEAGAIREHAQWLLEYCAGEAS